MASMTFTVPDAIGQRVVDGFAVKHGYEPTVIDEGTGDEVPNPESKFAFMGRLVSEYIVQSVAYAEIQAAAEAAREAAEQDARAALQITVS